MAESTKPSLTADLSPALGLALAGGGGADSGHPVELYLQLAGGDDRFQSLRQVREWLRLGSVQAVVSLLLGRKGLLPPEGDYDPIQALRALCAWALLPPVWIGVGYGILWSQDVAPCELVDCDGQAWDSRELVAEWGDLLNDPDGYSLALTALNLARNYRHILWEFLLRPQDSSKENSGTGDFVRQEADLMTACLARVHTLPQPGSTGSNGLVGELFVLGNDVCFVQGGVRWDVPIPEDLYELLRGYELGRARIIWTDRWSLQWVEVGGDLLRIDSY